MENIQGYTLIEKINENAFTEVFRAGRSSDGSNVIIKIFNARYLSSFEVAGLKKEYELVRKAGIKGIIQPLDFLEYDGRYAIVLESFEGIPLNTVFKNHPVSISTFLNIAASVSESLGNLHKINITHMGIKPDNILVHPFDFQVRISCFDVSARLIPAIEETNHPDMINNTLIYLSPEQTGRMNRQVDYRTDLYSLGVSFYELLTGQPPFLSHDPMEIIHAHLAKKPLPPHQSNPDIPETISDIILKLMAKPAEERYQNSFGLLADLQRCIDELKVNGTISSFPLGRKDISLTFSIPRKLYGRNEEVQRLLNGFDNVCDGTSGVMLVSGSPGIGKTALITEIQKPVLEKQGFFISGKYEQLRREVPYSAIILAFQGLIRQLLRESREMIKAWKETLLEALSPNEAIITQMIPDVAYIIGTQPEIEDMGSEEFKNRFILAFKNFIKVFAQKNHPLVLFLDDLQWADLSSLQLISSIASDPDVRYLYMITSFRNTEITETHPFKRFMENIGLRNVPLTEIILKPLNLNHINTFIRDFLKCPENASRPLAELVLKKTGGNPFFINQFMKTLHDLKLLQADPESGWQWDLDRIRQLQITDNVVDLLSEKILNLDESTREMLKIGACIGQVFDLDRLSAILGTSMETIWDNARTAINEGYIEMSEGAFNFQHDRVREAAYRLVSEGDRQKIHYRIGRYALERPDTVDPDVFYIADHLNHAKNLIHNPEEKNRLARLNCLAGEKAIRSAAYASALTYLEYGISLLDEHAWTDRYDLCIRLFKSAVAASCLDGRFEVMDAHFTLAVQKSRNTPDQIAFYEFKIMALIAQNNLPEAVGTGLAILRQTGITFPAKPGRIHVLSGFIRIKFALRGKNPEDLLSLPEMKNPEMLSAMRIMTTITTPAFNVDKNLVVLLGLKQVLLSLQYGNTSCSSVAYAGYGMLLCAILEDFDTGYEFGRLAVNLLEKLHDNEFKPQVTMIFQVFIRHWKENVQKIPQDLLEGFQIGKETGNLAYGAYCLFMYCGHALLAGKELSVLDDELDGYLKTIQQMNQETPYIYTRIIKQLVLNLTGRSDDPTRLAGSAYDEDEMLPVHYKIMDRSALAYLYCHKLFLCCLFNNLKDGHESAGLMKTYFDGTMSTLNDARYYLFSALIDIDRYNDVKRIEKFRIRCHVRKSLRKLEKFARHCPKNSLFAFQLLTAAYAGNKGQDRKACGFYDKAVTAARQSGFTHYEAFCNETAARFYLSRHHINLARFHMWEAWMKYAQWGASAKVAHIETLYPDLIYPGRETVTAIPDTSGDHYTRPSAMPARKFDFFAVSKSSEAIFGEIILNRLLKRLMRILIENAGAEKGFIILGNEDSLLVEAEGNVSTEEVDILKSIPVENHEGLSCSIVTFAARMKETLILNNALTEGEFTRDPYVLKNQPKSILCMPILNQGRLSAVLYLENTLATNVFTPERLHVLNILSSQIAVAIDNAKLYENLEQKVEERTIQLKNAQEENLKKAHRAGMADIAKETLHNVGNILNSIKTIADTINKHTMYSALTGMTSANQILKEHMENLQKSIADDPRGIKIMDYYSALESFFYDEKDHTDRQIDRLRRKVNEIVTVIQELQNHIGNDDAYLENIRLKEEVKFVLETKRDNLASGNIKIMEIYNDVPVIRAQKSKLAYILDTLITNAKEAMENAPEEKKVITIEITKHQDKVILHIHDNGIGIPRENIQRIFFHGFTTKTGRTGHSLHNCANSMTEIGGKIFAESNGAGKGTTFTLEFPVL